MSNKYIDSSKINILFILPSLRRAGAEVQVIDLIKGFDKTRFEIILFTFDENVSLKHKLKSLNIIHVNYPRRYKFDFSMIPEMAKVINDYKIDIIHTSLQISLLFGSMGRFFANSSPPIVHTLHKTLARNTKEDILEKYIYQWPMRRCAKIICVCKNQEVFWIKKFPYLKGRTQVIYNGVDTNYFNSGCCNQSANQLRSDLGLPESSKIIACVAGFRKEKNHSGLVKIFSELKIEGEQPYLLLAGEGPERKKIESLVEEKQLSGRVFFLGNLSDVRPLLAIADVSVIPSIAVETFSIAMLESMSMACPVVSTDIGGHKEAIVNDKTGYTVSLNDASGFRKALYSILTDRKKQKSIGRLSREIVQEKFSYEIMVNLTEKIVKSVYRNSTQ